MAEMSGLRPLKETSTAANAGPMHGAYDIYVQDNRNLASAGQNYYAAKWMKFAAGTYIVRAKFDDSGDLKIDGMTVILSPAVEDTFTIQTNSVVRFDVHYRNHDSAADPSYAVYEILKADGTLIEVSRANDFIGDTIPIPDSALGVKPPYNEDARLSYPVFLPKPNWAGGIIERLEWNTDVLSSETGAEQRRKLRHVPRRSFEGSFNAFGNNRNLIDSYIAGVGANNGLIPVWHDETRITSKAVAGSVDLFGDFRWRDFGVNDLVIIRRGDTFDYELNIVAELNAYSMVLATGLQVDTSRDSTVTPIRVGQVRDQVTGSMLTDRVQQYGLRFYVTGEPVLTPSWGDLPFYTRTNIPILTLQPNYKEDIALTFDRNLYPWDNEIGNVYTADPGNWVSTSQKFSYHIQGRSDLWRFKQMLYKMSGRWREFHIPTGHDDIALSREVSSSQGALIAYRSGYSQYNLNNQNTRRDILIELWDGTLMPNTIISSRVVGDEEWLFLSETTPAIPKELVKRISYMPRGRLDIDGIEIQRLTDADGAATVSLTFKTLDERRVAPPVTF